MRWLLQEPSDLDQCCLLISVQASLGMNEINKNLWWTRNMYSRRCGSKNSVANSTWATLSEGKGKLFQRIRLRHVLLHPAAPDLVAVLRLVIRLLPVPLLTPLRVVLDGMAWRAANLQTSKYDSLSDNVLNESVHEKITLIAFANSADPDQPVHLQSDQGLHCLLLISQILHL